jgi:phage terminase large subunit-like protein
MRQQSPQIKSLTKKRQSDIYFPATMSTLKAIASDTKTMDGLNAHFFCLDEWHEARDSKVYDVMIQSQAAREQPLAWLISTNGYVREMFFDDKYNYCSKVALWEPGFEDYRLLPLLYELDERDEWKKPECWEKANPGLGKIKSLTTLADNVEKAKRDPTFLPTVLTKDFNEFANSNAAWLTYEAAVNETVVPMEYLEHSYAIGGCDLSSTTDLTCASLLIRKPNDDNYYVLQKYFLPQSRVDDEESGSKREAPYKLWAEQGWLHICEGAAVDYHAVTEWFIEMVEQHDIRPLWICYDRALAGYWQNEMAEYGFDMVKIAQGPYTFTYPMKRMGAALEDHKVVYQNNPMLRWCLLNTGVKTLNRDGINSIQPVKTGATKRIDGMVSLLNAWVGYCDKEDEYMRYLR